MKILLTGSKGQLGHAIRASKPTFIDGKYVELLAMDKKAFDLSNPEMCKLLINKIKPEWVINAGAYTNVDAAEDNQELVMKVNSKAPKAIAEALLETGGKLIQISTDFVFDGSKGKPIKASDRRNPINTYGKSKALAEEYLEDLIIPKGQCTILRTSWLMGKVSKNFALTMIKLHNELDTFEVVSDQIGGPTSTQTLTTACWKIIERQASGIKLPSILHWCDAGAASWYDIAIIIGELGESIGIIKKKANIKPISTSDYPTKANRPSYSILDCFETRKELLLEPLHWQTSLKDILHSLPKIN